MKTVSKFLPFFALAAICLLACPRALAQNNVTMTNTFSLNYPLDNPPTGTFTNEGAMVLTGTISGTGSISISGTITAGSYSATTGSFSTLSAGTLTVSGNTTVSGSSTLASLSATTANLTTLTASTASVSSLSVSTLLTSSVSKLTTVSLAGSLLGSSPTLGIGYGAGSGSTSTQLTSKATGVTLNGLSGQITMNTASLASATNIQFTLTDSAVAANDVLVPAVSSGGTMGSYQVWTAAMGTGTAEIAIRNVNAATLSESPVISFVIIKGSSN